MEGKKVPPASPGASENGLETNPCFFNVLGRLWERFALPQVSFFTDFGSLLGNLAASFAILEPFWLTLNASFTILGPFRQPPYSKASKKAPNASRHQNRRKPAKNMPRAARNIRPTSREPAEDPLQEPALRTLCQYLASTLRFLQTDLAYDKCLEQKWGGGAPPCADFN